LPNALVQKIEELKGARRAAGLSKATRLIWEPKPSACEISHLQEHLQACKLVDVFSPNHVELVSLVEGIKTAPFSRNVVERCAKRLVDSGVGSDNDGIVLVRCGEHGSMICRRSRPPKWFPPYHTSSAPVVDATGAGNSFLGGFIAGMNLSSGDPIEAVIHGTVAASLVIEQFGLPILDQGPNYERWNGKIVASRLQEYRARVALV
jgi:sugar/nucleoside kinase (ribokinase family)